MDSSNSNVNNATDLLKKAQVLLSLNLFSLALNCSENLLQLLKPQTQSTGKENANGNGRVPLPYEKEKLDLLLTATEVKGKALLGMGQFEDAILFLGREIKYWRNLNLNLKTCQSPECLEILKKHIEHWKYFVERGLLLQRVRLQGEIDMTQFLPNKKVRLGPEIVPEYESPSIRIAVRIEGKGRGVLAAEEIKEGTLILSCRAFEIIFDTEDEDDELELAISNRMKLDDKLVQEVYQLWAGKDFESKESKGKIDLKRIAGICTMNSFGNSRNSNGYGHNSRGLWVRASFFNHDCIDFNCVWKVLGDFLFVRTVKRVKKGEELTISYTDSAEPLEEREKFFQAHEFLCSCRLCKFQRKTEGVQVRKERGRILKEIERLDDKDRTNETKEELEIDIASAEKLLKELESLSSKEKPEWNFAPHLAFDVLTKLYLRKGDAEGYKRTAGSYYFVVNCSGLKRDSLEVSDLSDKEKRSGRGPCLEVGAAAQVASVFLKAGDFQGASEWIRLLKEDLFLVYGMDQSRDNVLLKKLYPTLFAQALKNGLKF